MEQKGKQEWYQVGKKFWEESEPTVDGMLGGYGHTSGLDIEWSKGVLDRYIGEGLETDRCIDCGAGIGRITKDLLVERFT